MDPGPLAVQELVGVYHANGSLWGELSYWLGARLGRAHCALCDITHGSVREKPEWQRCRVTLSVPVRTLHLDEQPADLAALTEGTTPCVVARTAAGSTVLVGPSELEACAGSPAALVETIERAAADRGLALQT